MVMPCGSVLRSFRSKANVLQDLPVHTHIYFGLLSIAAYDMLIHRVDLLVRLSIPSYLIQRRESVRDGFQETANYCVSDCSRSTPL